MIYQTGLKHLKVQARLFFAILFAAVAAFGFAAAFPGAVPRSYAAGSSEEQKYDSTQWYFKARYLYEQRHDGDAAKKAIIKACELDFDNAEAFAYMYVLADRLKFPVPEEFIFKVPDYMGSSGTARRWYINGVEAFGRRDFPGALFCFEQAAKDDLVNEQVSYMINASRREILLTKVREKIEARFGGPASPKSSTVTENEGNAPPGAAESPAAAVPKPAPGKDGTGETALASSENEEERDDPFRERYLSIKTARLLLKNGVKTYDPKKFTEWLGFARYVYNVNRDNRNALLAIDTALLFYDSNETALKLKSEIAAKVKAEDEAEKERERRERAAMEKARLQRIQEEKDRRSVAVSEVVIAGGPEKPVTEKEVRVTGDFTDEDFIIDTAETRAGEEEVVAPSNKPVAMPVGEIVLANDEKPSTERKKLIEDTKNYVIRHSKLASVKYGEGKVHEALLEYEKIYERILQIDPNDVKSLYSLVLLYKKMGEQRNAQHAFIKLVNAINATSAKYSGSKNIQKIYSFVDCAVKASIVNAAVLAYNQKSHYAMNRSNFDINKLKEKNYLVVNEGEDREVMLSLAESGPAAPDRMIKTYKFVINGYNCRSGGKFSLGPGGVVTCSVHGDSVLILSGQELDRVRNDQ